MNLSNLQEGQVINSYKALCDFINVKVTTGEAKQKQIEEFGRYVKYRKNGNKFIIEEIISQPDAIMQSKSNSVYLKLIETLLAAHLVGNKSICIEYTYKGLFQLLCMVSDKYEDIYKKESYEYVRDNIAPIEKDVYLDFRRSTYNENKKKIRSALESMKRKMLIDYEEEMYVCYEDDEGKEQYKKPTEEEMCLYLEIGRNLLEKYSCRDTNELIEKHLKLKYTRELAEEMRKKLGWRYKYKKVKIINGITDSIEQLEKSKQELIKQARDEKIEINERELNNAIKKMINRIGENNHRNTVERLEEWERGDEEWGSTAPSMPYSLYSMLFRAKDTYLPAWNILSEYYISGDEDAAKDKAKEFSIDGSVEVEEDGNLIEID